MHLEPEVKSELLSYDPRLPLQQASSIPKSWYTSDSIYQFERRSVFADSWLAVARTEELKVDGSFVTRVIAGEPIVITRDNGQYFTFSNVCRHRAARVQQAECGTADCLRCPYHGWTYNLKGQLLGAPEMGNVDNFKKEQIHLPQWQIDQWQGIVFVSRAKPSLSLAQWMAPVDARMPHQLKDYHYHSTKRYTLNCNWKVFVDNYQDGGYHIRTIHPSLSSVLVNSEYQTELDSMTTLQYTPLKAGQVSSVRSGKDAYYWWVYPNLMINVYDEIMDTNIVIPNGPSQCDVIMDFYFKDSQNSEQTEKSIAVAHSIQDEDIGICEDVQRGLNSASYQQGRFSAKRESAGYYFHQLLAKQLQHHLQRSFKSTFDGIRFIT